MKKTLVLPSKKDSNLPLFIILLAALLLRAWHLNTQSLWLDELHTMREADPAISFSELFGYLRCCDQHPPLFFFIQRFLFGLFGHTQLVGRIFPMLVGVISVWAIYLLGKEVLNKNLGLITAAFTAVNYFAIAYSQEARDYILVFLFSILSYLYFIRLIKNLRAKDSWLYALFTLLMLYSHYYGLFIVFSQFVIAFLLLFTAGDQKKLFIRRFLVAGIVIALGFAPWVPFVMKMSQIHSFWIAPIPPDFFITYFKQYFGNSRYLQPLLVILLAYYCVRVFMQYKKEPGIRQSPLLLSFVVALLSILFTYLLPYLRSITTVPMLFDRYTIVIVPLFLLCIAYGVELIPYKLAKYAVSGIFILLSLINLFFTQNYYNGIHKTQYRELTAFMMEGNGRQYPIINARTSWQMQYYLDHSNYKETVFKFKPADVVDSILSKSSSMYDVPGFWLMDAHGAGPMENGIDSVTRVKLLKEYKVAKEQKFYDAWAQLYMRTGDSSKVIQR
ncbi:MAG: glycosyltransferase family 39 protein [Bacteroidetes bacterium]|nr:glycosyltransferase family 39 protein [Bacteroidota bacterium]